MNIDLNRQHFMGAVFNQTFLYEGSLEITLTVPLNLNILKVL